MLKFKFGGIFSVAVLRIVEGFKSKKLMFLTGRIRGDLSHELVVEGSYIDTGIGAVWWSHFKIRESVDTLKSAVVEAQL